MKPQWLRRDALWAKGVLPAGSAMRGARARCFASVRVRTKVRTVRTWFAHPPSIPLHPPRLSSAGSSLGSHYCYCIDVTLDGSEKTFLTALAEQSNPSRKISQLVAGRKPNTTWYGLLKTMSHLEPEGQLFTRT